MSQKMRELSRIHGKKYALTIAQAEYFSYYFATHRASKIDGTLPQVQNQTQICFVVLIFLLYDSEQVLENALASGMSPRKSVTFFTSIGFTPMGGMEREYKTLSCFPIPWIGKLGGILFAV